MQFFNPIVQHYAILLLQDELEAELEELEEAELEDELLQPATTAPATSANVNVPVGRQPTEPAPQRNNREEDELAALQAEMALWEVIPYPGDHLSWQWNPCS